VSHVEVGSDGVSARAHWFAGQVAFVTGAGSGIGKAVASLLAKHGAAVALVDRHADSVERVGADILAGGGRALSLQADVSKATEVSRAVDLTIATFGALTLGVNSAGVAGLAAPVGELDPAEWDATIGINLSGVFYGMRYEIPAMLAAGGGSIVNISSVFADRGQVVRAAYAAAKHGIRGLTRSAAIDYAARGIRINELQPGVIDTPLHSADYARVREFASLIPAHRMGTTEEIAATVAFLLSDDASYINGAHIAVDGGFLA
jgi:NAD(P)-dependent dehydrogenase (short-subunit alcohol dehydrogenase family)